MFGGATVDVLSTLNDASDLVTNAGTVVRGFGGVGKNVAECIFRLGHSPLIVSVIGRDPWGHSIKKNLESIGMSHKGLFESPNR